MTISNPQGKTEGGATIEPVADTGATPERAAGRQVAEVFRLRHLGNRQKERLLAHGRVLIESDNGFWRANRAGYTFQDTAAEYTGADAYSATSHCGPEKRVRYHLLSADGATKRQAPAQAKPLG